MLLDENPAQLISATLDSFRIEDDKNAIVRINDSLSNLQQARDLRTREAESVLRKLSRNLSTLSSQHAETISSHSTISHASQILELDNQKFRIAKAASDLETEGERLEQELEGLRARLAELDAQGVEGDESERAKREADNHIVLSLGIYRRLGIDVKADSFGIYNKATIRNSRKGNFDIVINDPKISRYLYANQIWQTL